MHKNRILISRRANRFLLFTPIFVLALAVNAAHADESAENKTTPQRILCIGDSITFEDQWVKDVGNHPSFETVDAGRNGRKTKEGRETLASYLEKGERFDRLILFLGVNDLPTRVELPNDEKVAGCVRNMEETIDLALTVFERDHILLLAPCGINPDLMNEFIRKKGYHVVQPMLEQLEKDYEALAQKKGIQFLSLLHVVSKENYWDGLHPSKAGQPQIAKAILDFLTNESNGN